MAKRSTWLEYDWSFDGEEAVFGVELSLYRNAPIENLPLLLCFSCEKADGSALAPAEIKRARKLAEKCSRQTKLSPVGSVATDAALRFYFYAGSKEAYDRMSLVAEKEKKLVCRLSGKPEEDWETYFGMLYPDEIKQLTVKNREQVDKLRKIGDNTEATRRINLHVCFRGEQDRLMFEETARRSGFAIGGSEFISESDRPNGVVIHRISTLQPADINGVTIKTVELAEKNDGKLIYWDCNIVPKSVTRRF